MLESSLGLNLVQLPTGVSLGVLCLPLGTSLFESFAPLAGSWVEAFWVAVLTLVDLVLACALKAWVYVRPCGFLFFQSLL